MTDDVIRCAQREGTTVCSHLREEVRIVPGVRKKLLVGRCLLKARDSEARAEITRAMQDTWVTDKDHPDCWVFATGSWESCPRYSPSPE